MPTFSFHSSSATRERALSAICTSAYLLASEGGRYAGAGAGGGRLIRKTLTESALLSVLGGAAGLLFAKLGTSMLLTLRPEELARLSGIHMDTRVLLFVFVVSVLTGIVFGMAPAWIAARAD